MKKIFVSSVMNGFKSYRDKASSAIELLDYKVIKAETFGAKPYSSLVACTTELLQSDAMILIMGKRYGHVEKKISVTHEEYRAAREASLPIFVFVQDCQMDSDQKKFKDEVESYTGGFFRETFSDEEDLKDKIISSLRSYEKSQVSVDDSVFLDRVQPLVEMWNRDSNNGPHGAVIFWPHPTISVNLKKVEKESDDYFQQICNLIPGLMKSGYKLDVKANVITINSMGISYSIFEDGLRVVYFSVAQENGGFSTFDFYYIDPKLIKSIYIGAQQLNKEVIAHSMMAIFGMESRFIGAPIKGNSTSVPMGLPPSQTMPKFFNPYTKRSYEEWVERNLWSFQQTWKPPKGSTYS